MSASCPPLCRRVGIAQHSLLAQLNDDEPAVVAELVALVTELKADGGVVEVRGSGYQNRVCIEIGFKLTSWADHGAQGRGRGH